MEHEDWPTIAALGAVLQGASACCVCASTPVRTPSGLRRLGELRLGDEVLSLAVESGELVPARIVGIRAAQRECMRLVHPGGELVCTPDHPIYSPESGEYEPASRWADGVRRSVLRVVGQPAAAVVETEAFVGVREVIDITVDAPMHNFVAGGLLVHNKSYDTMIDTQADGPAFVLEADDRQVFELRACVEGRDPSGGTHGSWLQLVITSQADPRATTGDMSFGLLIEQEGRTLEELDSQGVGDQPYVGLVTLANACLSPLSIAFERVDGLPDGAIAFTWAMWGATDPPSGTSLDDELILEVTEVAEE